MEEVSARTEVEAIAQLRARYERQGAGLREKVEQPTRLLIETLATHALLDDEEVEQIEHLRRIRNAVSHGFLDTELPAGAADRLLGLADRLASSEMAA